MINVKPLTRHFLPQDFKITTWENLQPYAEDLASREISSLAEYQKFIADQDEFYSVFGEEASWRNIKKSCDTANKELEASYLYMINEIYPPITEYGDKINKKIAESVFAAEMNAPGFDIILKTTQSEINYYRPENIPLNTEINKKASESNNLRGARVVILDGEEMTPQKAADRLFWQDREKRKEAWVASRNRALEDNVPMSKLYDDMVKLRNQTALNAGFKNYQEYRFEILGRFDFSPEDCRNFNEAVRETVVPLVKELTLEQENKLGLGRMRPWDVAVDPEGKPPLKAFENAQDLIEKTKIVLGRVHPDFASTLQLMEDRGNLDIDSRANKRPGGFMCGLDESKVPFVFANVTQKVRDAVTLIHEVGHAQHEIEKSPLKSMYGNYPAEVAELASMSMELLTMDHWDVFFTNKEECIRAKREHLESIIELFPSVAMVDEFQHEVYLNPKMSLEQRDDLHLNLLKQYGTGLVDWSGYEDIQKTGWQNTHHMFSSPFYYIEYSMAQMGALQIWKNYKENPENAVQQYRDALALGYTKSVPEIYETAGIKFDFSQPMLKGLMDFVQNELKTLSEPDKAISPVIKKGLQPN